MFEPRHIPVIAELGVNYNGSLQMAQQLVIAAAKAGADFVKLQKRTPELAVPKTEWNKLRVPPWGGEAIPYIDYRRKMELSKEGYAELIGLSQSLDLRLFASVWDIPSLEFMLQFNPPFIKIPSAKLTDLELVQRASASGIPLILSTGMSTLAEINAAWGALLPRTKTTLFHCHSAYPAPEAEHNLSMIGQLHTMTGLPIGFSSHSISPFPAVAAVAWGACMVEAHLTLDRALPGSDHAASLEPPGFALLVREVRRLQALWGDGVKRVWPSELPGHERLRGNPQDMPGGL